eukprot:scaffold546_cov352-Prasinococcus_capsulatus_cf.AAC.6
MKANGPPTVAMQGGWARRCRDAAAEAPAAVGDAAARWAYRAAAGSLRLSRRARPRTAASVKSCSQGGTEVVRCEARWLRPDEPPLCPRAALPRACRCAVQRAVRRGTCARCCGSLRCDGEPDERRADPARACEARARACPSSRDCVAARTAREQAWRVERLRERPLRWWPRGAAPAPAMDRRAGRLRSHARAARRGAERRGARRARAPSIHPSLSSGAAARRRMRAPPFDVAKDKRPLPLGPRRGARADAHAHAHAHTHVMRTRRAALRAAR